MAQIPARPSARPAPPKPAATPADPHAMVTVRAIKLGFFNNQRKRPGDVFLVPVAQFTNNWMERVPDSTPPRQTTISEARRREHQEILASKAPGSQLQPNAVDPIAPSPSPVDE